MVIFSDNAVRGHQRRSHRTLLVMFFIQFGCKVEPASEYDDKMNVNETKGVRKDRGRWSSIVSEKMREFMYLCMFR